jgi:molybdopterin converting factor small subunit
VPLSDALHNSPHLAETLMLNGERCPLAEHGDRELADGDKIYLLAPLAGG